jgi:ADP-heptose:LPS heptosyltransferase
MLACLDSALPEDVLIRVSGTRSQFSRACEIVRGRPANRVSNDCGKLAWDEVDKLVASAACVIGNNSGIVHLAALYGVPTLCIFGGSHPRREWHPLSDQLILVSRAIACSPCQLDLAADCPYGKRCLEAIEPGPVADRILEIVASGHA